MIQVDQVAPNSAIDFELTIRPLPFDKDGLNFAEAMSAIQALAIDHGFIDIKNSHTATGAGQIMIVNTMAGTQEKNSTMPDLRAGDSASLFLNPVASFARVLADGGVEFPSCARFKSTEVAR